MGLIPSLIDTTLEIGSAFSNISETSTAYFIKDATNTDILNLLFKNVVQINYISLNGGIKNSPIKHNKSTIEWNPIPKVIQGTFDNTITCEIKLEPSTNNPTVTKENINKHTFKKLKGNETYNYTVTYSIGPFGEKIKGSLNSHGKISSADLDMLRKFLHIRVKKNDYTNDDTNNIPIPNDINDIINNNVIIVEGP